MKFWTCLALALAVGCTDQRDPERAEPAPQVVEEQTLRRRLPPTEPRYAQGIVNPLIGAFKRFDGFHLASSLWPNLSRFHAQLDQHDAAKGFVIGFIVIGFIVIGFIVRKITNMFIMVYI